MDLQVLNSYKDLQVTRAQWMNKTLGFVPTMGALHSGHMELIKKSKAENDLTLVSIFVNPTQFNSQEDLEKYPSTLEADKKLIQSEGGHFLFTPNYQDLYPDEFSYKIIETQFSHKLCGEHRPGHFDGVLTVVMKLLNMVRPTRAYFGEKDFQQLHLIQGMAQAFFLDVEIVPVPTVRDSEGLALSSRNLRLSPRGLQKARAFAHILKEAPTLREAQDKLQEAQIEVEYLESYQNRKFAAVWIDGVRLIDNVP